MKKIFSFVGMFSLFLLGYCMVGGGVHAQVSSISLPSKTHDISSILNRLVDMSTWSKWKDSSIFKQNDNLKHFQYIADLIANTAGEKQKNVFLDHVSEIQKDKKTSGVVDRVLAGIAEKLYPSEIPLTSEPDENKKSIVGEQRKAEALQFLKDNGMDTPENRALINAVQFTPDAIEIGGVKWAYENLKASDVGMKYTTDTAENPAYYRQAHIFKGEGDFVDEDYFTREAVRKIHEERKGKIPTYEDLRKTIATIPGGPVGKDVPTTVGSISRTKGSTKILSILLGMQMSGYRRDGVWHDGIVNSFNGFFWSSSPHSHDINNAWAFIRDNSGGNLSNFFKMDAFPVRPLAK